jgi:hypothetical protein
MCNNYFAGKVREIEGGFGRGNQQTEFWALPGHGCADAWCTQDVLWGSSAPPARMGRAPHGTLSVGCAVALPATGCFFDQGVTTFWRCGMAYGSPMETVPAEPRGACRRPHVALDAVRVS